MNTCFKIMMVPVSLLTVLGAYSDATPSVSVVPLSASDYRRPIEVARHTERVDMRDMLYQCVQHWEAYSKARALLFDQLRQNQWRSRSGNMLLEIGDSNGYSYGFSLAIDRTTREKTTLLKTGFAVLDEPAIQHALRNLNIDSLEGDASNYSWDAPCFFLTIVLKDGALKQIAVYGLPSTPVSQLIEAMSSYATKAKPDLPVVPANGLLMDEAVRRARKKLNTKN